MRNKNSLKKCISLVLSILIFLFSFSSVATAETIEKKIQLSLAPIYSKNFDIELANSLTSSQEELAEYINAQLKAYEPVVDISKFNLLNTGDNQQLIVNILSSELPECFHIGTSFSFSLRGSYIVSVIPQYEYSKSQYLQMLNECENRADELLEGIEGNYNLTTEEKLLLLHDRIALICEYDTDLELTGEVSRPSHTMYGVFVNGIAVCQGYSIAYGYLLDRIGIKNSYCSSASLRHAWNIVYVNNKPYHVDITWDDPTCDMAGRVNHNNFLLSTDALWYTEHDAFDYDTTPQDTTYDDYFWKRSTTAFTLVDDEIYYIDNEDETIKRMSDGAVIESVDRNWKKSSTSRWTKNYAKLDTDGTNLLYSLDDGIYRYQFDTRKSTKIYSPDLPEYHNVFGFTLDRGELIIEAGDTPNYDAYTKENYTIRVPYSFNCDGDEGHSYSGDCDATCNYCYTAREVAVNHIYSDRCDEKCNVCFERRTNTPHRYANNCDKVCDCGATRTVDDHKYTSDCDKTCNICGATRTVDPHVYGNNCDTTCNVENCGFTRKAGAHKYKNVCDKTCNICGATRKAGAHKYTNKCDTSCNVCKAVRKITHTYKTTTTKATLKKNGKVVKKCSVCGKAASTTTVYYPKTIKIAATSYTYTGKVVTPAVTIKGANGKALKKGTDYTVTYAKGRKNVGNYKVTVNFKGNYKGTKKLNFTIYPVKTTINEVVVDKRNLKIAISKKKTQVTGYQVQYCLTDSFKSVKTKSTANSKNTSVIFNNLNPKNTFYIRVRTYKKVNGVKYYSLWTNYRFNKTK